jgi:putative endonuclease
VAECGSLARQNSAGPPSAEKLTTKMPCIYILYSESKEKIYVGSSREIDSKIRLQSHNAGRSRSTKSGRPWILIHEEFLQSYADARKKELFLKSGQGRSWIKEKWKTSGSSPA